MDINQPKSGQLLGRFRLLRELGRGGNGQVWQAVDPKAKEQVALKILLKQSDAKRLRFVDELGAMRDLQDIAGVVRVVDFCEDPPTPWYVMPIGVPILAFLKDQDFEAKVRTFASLARTLTEIHAKGYSHRDIKPDNILMFTDQPVFSDFGLVHFPEKNRRTFGRDAIGSRSTIAPEMRNAGSQAEYRPADVFSLGKSLWILLTGELDGFDGHYGREARESVEDRYRREFLDPIHEALDKATMLDPSKRPSAEEFAELLEDWIELAEDSREKTSQHWRRSHGALFRIAYPSRAEWNELDQIRKVLTQLARTGHVHHMYFPDGGGLDLEGVVSSDEEGMIELDVGGAFLQVKPVRLRFEGFEGHEDWNYYWLECADTPEPSDLPSDSEDQPGIEFLEITRGVLVHRRHKDWGDWEGIDIPESARIVRRPKKGTYLFVGKQSAYNKVPATYDGRHNAASAAEFRNFIERQIEKFAEKKKGNLQKDFLVPRYQREGTAWLSNKELRPQLSEIAAEAVGRIVKLAEDYRAKYREIMGESDGVSVFDIDPDKWRKLAELEKPMIGALKSLSADSRNELLAIMLAGREALGIHSYRLSTSMWNHFIETAKRIGDDSVSYMSEKSALDQYLTRGFELFSSPPDESE